jgi:hypothetical protein
MLREDIELESFTNYAKISNEKNKDGEKRCAWDYTRNPAGKM